MQARKERREITMAKSEINVSFRFHSGEEKPMHSGYYLAIYNVSIDNDKYMSVYYNAETKKWNDITGKGEYSIKVYAWAEETKEIYEQFRAPMIGDVRNV